MIQFIKADPTIALNKNLSDTTWLVYCRLEQIAKTSRFVLGYHTRAGFPEAATVAALAELSTLHPTAFTLDGYKLTLAKSPTKFVRLPWMVIDANIPTWQKRVVTAIIEQVYETTVNRRVGSININKLLTHCRIPARTRKERWALVHDTINAMVREGIVEILSQRPGACTTCRLLAPGEERTWGATCGAADPDGCGATCETSDDPHHRSHHKFEASRTTGSAEPHHKFDEVAPHPSGQKPKKETQKETKEETGGEPTKAPAGEEPLIIRDGKMTHTESNDEETPRKPRTWELIESTSPCKSTDSPDELAELWKDRRSAIVAMYYTAGIDPHPETIVADVRQIMGKTFNGKLSLGALLGPKWGQLEKALTLWLGNVEARIWQHLPYLLASTGRDLTRLTDTEITHAWDRVTGSAVPCPPVAVIRRLAA